MSTTGTYQLESLSNELLLDIFEYLDAYNLCQAFHGLNSRFNKLLGSTNLHIICAPKQSNDVWNTVKSFIDPSKIRAITSEQKENIPKLFLSSTTQNLSTVHIGSMSRAAISEIFSHFPNGNKIKCLSVGETWDYSNRNIQSFPDFVLTENGERFTSLINLEIFATYGCQFSKCPIIFEQLRRLSIVNINWTRDLLEFLQTNTPNLRSLKYYGYVNESDFDTKFVFKQLTELHINFSNDLSVLRYILIMCPNLRRLHIDWENTQWCIIADGKQWEQLIEKCTPNLKQLTLTFDQGIDEEILSTFYNGEFWSTKKVRVIMTVSKTVTRLRLVKSISFGPEWEYKSCNKYS